MKAFFILLLGLFTNLHLNAKVVDFYKEQLFFSLEADSFMVEGIYFFVNHSINDYHGELWYPLPDSTINKVELFNNNFQKTILHPQKAIDWGVSIPLSINAGDSTFIIVRYGQKIKDKGVSYILTSTTTWGKPLREAHFKLMVTSSFSNLQFSFPPQFEMKINKHSLYIWKFKNFYPQKDFWLFWE